MARKSSAICNSRAVDRQGLTIKVAYINWSSL